MSQTKPDRVELYQTSAESDDALFLWRQGDYFAIEDVQRADNQGEGVLRGITEHWLDYEDHSQGLAHPDDVYESLFPGEIARGENRPSTMDYCELIERLGPTKVAICKRGANSIEMVNDPGPNARRFLGLSDEWRFGIDRNPS